MKTRPPRAPLSAMKVRATKLMCAVVENKKEIGKSRNKSRAVRLSFGVQNSIKLKNFWEDKATELLTAIGFLEGRIDRKDYVDPI